MLQWILSSAMLAAAMILLRGIFKGRISPRLQYALWLVVLLRLLVPGSLFHSRLSVSNAVRESGLEVAVQSFIITEDRGGDAPADISKPGEPMADNNKVIYHNKNYVNIFKLVWLSGAAAVMGVFLFSNLNFAVKLLRSRKKISCSSPLPVYSCRWIESPCLFGLISPAVYLAPESCRDEDKLKHIVLHEYMHYKQLDHIWAMLRCLCLALHWFDPLVWAAAFLSKRDSELACDAAVIKHIGEERRADYGRTLLSLSYVARPGILTAATTMAGSKRALRERIKFIAHSPHTAVLSLVLVISLSLAVCGCAFAGAEYEEEEAADVVVAEAQASPQPSEPVIYEESFPSHDGSVDFNAAFELRDFAAAMPRISAEFRSFTLEESMHAAEVLFGTAELYEYRQGEYSKEAVEEYMAILRRMEEDEEFRLKVFGQGSELIVANLISQYGNESYYENSVSDADREKMNWEFVSYNNGTEDFVIEGRTESGGIRYRFQTVRWAEPGAVNDAIYADVEGGWLAEAGRKYQYYLHSSPTAPDEEQLKTVGEKAADLIGELGFGQWQVDICAAKQMFDGEYIVRVKAVPVYGCFPLIRQNKIYTGMNTGRITPEIHMDMGVDGTILYIRCISPMEQLSLVSGSDRVIDFNTAMDKAEEYLKGRSVGDFDQWLYGDKPYHEGVRSEVFIEDVRQGLIISPETEAGIILTPVYSLMGYYQSFDESGVLVYDSRSNEMGEAILNINALDGTVIDARKAETA